MKNLLSRSFIAFSKVSFWQWVHIALEFCSEHRIITIDYVWYGRIVVIPGVYYTMSTLPLRLRSRVQIPVVPSVSFATDRYFLLPLRENP